jgi:hypothetical protein
MSHGRQMAAAAYLLVVLLLCSGPALGRFNGNDGGKFLSFSESITFK